MSGAHHHPAAPAFTHREGAQRRAALHGPVDQVAQSARERREEQDAGEEATTVMSPHVLLILPRPGAA